MITIRIKIKSREAPWPSGRVWDSGARGRGFDPHSGRHVVSLSKIHQDTYTSPKVLVIRRKWWLGPDMTEKIVDWDVKPQPKQTNKQTNKKSKVNICLTTGRVNSPVLKKFPAHVQSLPMPPLSI